MSRLNRFGRVVKALRADRRLAPNESLPSAERHALQRALLRDLVAHAVARSPFYAQLYREHGVGPDTPLERLPVIDKATLMTHWDDIPVDRSLRLSEVRAALDAGEGVVRGHHIFQTGGTSGHPGVFAYDAKGIDGLILNTMRALRYNGVRPRLPRRLRMSMVWAPGTQHLAARISSLIDVGLYDVQRLPASAPVPQLVSQLERHQPEVLAGYAMTLSLLAAAQLDGMLDIQPRVVAPSSEPLTPAIRARIRAAWGVEPFDLYATTETGPIAMECDRHDGPHIYEDRAIVEADGTRVLVTNLYNRGFPLIRFVIDDLVVTDPSPCACGRTTTRLTSIVGRANDILELPAAAGGAPVSVHPSAWTPLTALDAVADAEVVQHNGTLIVRAVPRVGHDDTAEAVRRYVEATFVELGVGGVELRVEIADSLTRTSAGKRQLVRRA